MRILHDMIDRPLPWLAPLTAISLSTLAMLGWEAFEREQTRAEIADTLCRNGEEGSLEWIGGDNVAREYDNESPMQASLMHDDGSARVDIHVDLPPECMKHRVIRSLTDGNPAHGYDIYVHSEGRLVSMYEFVPDAVVSRKTYKVPPQVMSDTSFIVARDDDNSALMTVTPSAEGDVGSGFVDDMEALLESHPEANIRVWPRDAWHGYESDQAMTLVDFTLHLK